MLNALAPLVGKLIGGLLKALPFLAAYRAGKNDQKMREAQLALKRQKKVEKIKRRNAEKSDAQILRELKKDRRPR